MWRHLLTSSELALDYRLKDWGVRHYHFEPTEDGQRIRQARVVLEAPFNLTIEMDERVVTEWDSEKRIIHLGSLDDMHMILLGQLLLQFSLGAELKSDCVNIPLLKDIALMAHTEISELLQSTPWKSWRDAKDQPDVDMTASVGEVGDVLVLAINLLICLGRGDILQTIFATQYKNIARQEQRHFNKLQTAGG